MFSELRSLIAERGNLTKLFGLLKPVAKEPMDKGTLGLLIDYFQFKDIGLSGGVARETKPDSIYTGGYKTYQDWFTRNLSIDTEREIRKTLGQGDICIPNECVIESVGIVSDTSSILRLKRPPEVAVGDLYALGIPASHVFVNMKLLTGHYHHVRSPVTGRIISAIPIHKETPLFGRSSLNFIEIETPFGSVFMLIVGEAVVQDFDYAVELGQDVEIFDDLGNFTWGSQTVMFLPVELAAVAISRKEYHFAGDIVAIGVNR